jgi:hypothetical protein
MSKKVAVQGQGVKVMSDMGATQKQERGIQMGKLNANKKEGGLYLEVGQAISSTHGFR